MRFVIAVSRSRHLNVVGDTSTSSSCAPETVFYHQHRFLLHTSESKSLILTINTNTKPPASLQDVTTTSRSTLHSSTILPSTRSPSTSNSPTTPTPNNPHRNRIRRHHVLRRQLESCKHGPQRPSEEHHLANSGEQQLSRQSSLRPSLRGTQPSSRSTWRKQHSSFCE